MNREEAIAIIRKEYLCVDRDCDIERSCGKCDLMMPSKEPILEAYKMAIKALEQQPKTGHWEWVQYDYNPKLGNWHCSECRCVVVECVGKEEKGGIPLHKYCPQCGAKIEVSE